MTECPAPSDEISPAEEFPTQKNPPRVVAARLLVGLIVVICAEVFSGASVGMGLWSPWTVLVTFWLYFAHFFFFTSVAVYTGRTSLTSLYLWGVLYGLYEGWITKVIWHGYGGDGHFAMGSIGPFGFSEISMVFFFHPLISFILPLTVGCLIYPSLRRLFPDLAWLSGKTRLARFVQIYLVLAFVPVMAMNSGGTLNLAANLVFAVIALCLLAWWARGKVSSEDERAVVVFGRRGFLGLCVYLALLYGITYPCLRPDGLPSPGVQLLTVAIYAVTILGLYLQPRREPLPKREAIVDEDELPRVKTLFAVLLVLALACSPLAGTPFVFGPVVVDFILWSLTGFVLMAIALWRGAGYGLDRCGFHS